MGEGKYRRQGCHCWRESSLGSRLDQTCEASESTEVVIGAAIDIKAVGYSPDVQDRDAKGASWSIRWRQLRYVRIVSSARFSAPKFGGLSGSCRSWITICVWGDGGKGLIVMHQTNCRLIVVSSSANPNVVKCAAILRQLQPPRHDAWTLSNHKTPKRRHKR